MSLCCSAAEDSEQDFKKQETEALKVVLDLRPLFEHSQLIKKLPLRFGLCRPFSGQAEVDCQVDDDDDMLLFESWSEEELVQLHCYFKKNKTQILSFTWSFLCQKSHFQV